jgi:hypothetical protein
MIVRRLDADLLLINQDDHAALAGRIMAAWRADGLPQRPTRSRVLDATARHDVGWQIIDAAPSVDPKTGMPYEFVTAPLEVRQGVWPRALSQLAADDPYIAALVAHHAVTVYRRYAQTPGWEAFFPYMEGRRTDLLRTQALDFETFLQDYIFVGVGDLWSLVFCTGWLEPHSMERYRALLHAPVERGRAEAEIVDGGRLEITPDPFDEAVVSLEVAARRIPARQYTADDDLRQTVARAPTVYLTGTASGPSRP